MNRNFKKKLPLIAFLILALAASGAVFSATEAGTVNTMRVPNGGIQPQIIQDTQGKIHMIYFKGDQGAGDVFYVRSTDGNSWSSPIMVNTHPGSAMAVGNIRGAHLAIGKDSRAHVAWMGSKTAQPRGPDGHAPMLYARMNDGGTAFENQRNVMQYAEGLDGGGSIAADADGNVHVSWHAGAGQEGEAKRQIWVAKSNDSGKTFQREVPAFETLTGVCSCCGMKSFAAANGKFYTFYRSATAEVNRDMWLLMSQNKGASYQGAKVDSWKIGKCVMSSAYLAEYGGSVLAAWETKGQVSFSRIGSSGQLSPPVAAPGQGKNRKYPVVAGNKNGETLLTWTEGMGWNQGGSLAWQRYDKGGRPMGEIGKADGVPPWSLIAAYARPDGSFTIVY